MRQLWEVLVPKADGEGNEIPLAHHRAWDEKVRKLAGGLTILKTAKGVWTSPSGEICKEEMIPVRIACQESQISDIIDLVIGHYDQEAVMACLISEQVIIRHR